MPSYIGNFTTKVVTGDHHSTADDPIALGKIQLLGQDRDALSILRSLNLPPAYRTMVQNFAQSVTIPITTGVGATTEGTREWISPMQIIDGTDYIWMIYSGGLHDLSEVDDQHQRTEINFEDNLANSNTQHQWFRVNGVIAINKKTLDVVRCLDPDTGLVPVNGEKWDATWKTKLGWKVLGIDPTMNSWYDYNPTPDGEPYQMDGHPTYAYPCVTRIPICRDGKQPEMDALFEGEDVECLCLCGGWLYNRFKTGGDTDALRRQKMVHPSYTLRVYIPTPIVSTYTDSNAGPQKQTYPRERISVTIIRGIDRTVLFDQVAYANIGTSMCADRGNLTLYGGLPYDGTRIHPDDSATLSKFNSQCSKLEISASIHKVQRREWTGQNTFNYYLECDLRKCESKARVYAYNKFYVGEIRDNPTLVKAAQFSILPYMYSLLGNTRVVAYGSLGLDTGNKPAWSVKFPHYPYGNGTGAKDDIHSVVFTSDHYLNFILPWMYYTLMDAGGPTQCPLMISGDVGALEGRCPIPIRNNSELLLYGGTDMSRTLFSIHHPGYDAETAVGYYKVNPGRIPSTAGTDADLLLANSCLYNIAQEQIDQGLWFPSCQPYSQVLTEDSMSQVGTGQFYYYIDSWTSNTPYEFSICVPPYECTAADVVPVPGKNEWLLIGSLLSEPMLPGTLGPDMLTYYPDQQFPPIQYVKEVEPLDRATLEAMPDDIAKMYMANAEVICGELITTDKLVNRGFPLFYFHRALPFPYRPHEIYALYNSYFGNRMGDVLLIPYTDDNHYVLLGLNAGVGLVACEVWTDVRYHADTHKDSRDANVRPTESFDSTETEKYLAYKYASGVYQ
jgi:hypothetical protein